MKIKMFLRLCSHFLIAVIFAFILASLLHSQFVIAELVKVGVEVSFTDRLSMSIDDILGLYPTYGVIIGISLLLAFAVTSAIVQRVKMSPYLLYFVAGIVGISAALSAMQPILDITFIAGARSTFGFICQSLAGGMGGLVFWHLRKPIS